MQIRSRVVRSGVWIVLGLVAGCEEPALTVGSLVVTVFIDPPSVMAIGANVTLLATTQAGVTDASGNVTFPLVLPGTYQVRASMIGYCQTEVTATVSAGATTNVTMTIAAAPCLNGTDWIATGGTEPFYGLVDIRTGISTDSDPCPNDRLVESTSGSADLLTNALSLIDVSITCHGAAWIFTANHAPWFDNTAATFPWTNSGGDVLTTTLPANRLRVPVTIWISDPAINEPIYRAQVTDDLSKANGFLLSMRSGLVLTNSAAANTPPDIIHVGGLADGPGNPTYGLIGFGCDHTPSITSSVAYRSHHINVYAVEAIVGDGSPSGRNCVGRGAKNVIFIKRAASHVTLLHEIGHAIGLYRPSWGHADAIKGMIPDNVMWSGASVAGHLTLGQIVRAHADTSSWLNSASSPLQTACHCPGDTATPDCPTITKDIPRGMPGVGMDDPACHVTTDVSCLSLPPLMTGYITARGFTDDVATKDGFGEGSVGSLSPTIATATLFSEDGKTVMAEVIAGSSSGTTTHVLMSLGGTFVKVKVNVGTVCPP